MLKAIAVPFLEPPSSPLFNDFSALEDFTWVVVKLFLKSQKLAAFDLKVKTKELQS